MTDLMQSLVDHISSQPEFKRANRVYVSVYRHHRCYGGPEEGGWWYSVNEFQGSVPFFNREQAEAWLEHAKKEIEAKNREEAPSRYRAMENLPDEDEVPCPANCPEGYIPSGWDDGGELQAVIEEQPGSMDNTNEPRPHYE